MQIRIYSVVRFQWLVLLLMFVFNAVVNADDSLLSDESDSLPDLMDSVEYELPDALGTLTLEVPIHWDSTKAQGVNALWINQGGNPFKDNITLTIHPVEKVDDGEQLLDFYLSKLIESGAAKPVSEAEKLPARRSMFFESEAGGLELAHQVLAIYTETSDKSYLIVLNHSRLRNGVPIDLSVAAIKN